MQLSDIQQLSPMCDFVPIFRTKLKTAYGYYAENDANLMYEVGTRGRALDLNAVFKSIDQISQQDVAKVTFLYHNKLRKLQCPYASCFMIHGKKIPESPPPFPPKMAEL